MKKNKIIGVILVATPPLLFVGALVAYAITSYVVSNISVVTPVVNGLAQPTKATTTLEILRVVYSLAGILGVLGFFTAVPAGIYFLFKHQDEKNKLENQPQNQ
jgi:hypothetical protein